MTHTIADEVRLILATHVDQLTELNIAGRLVSTSDIVALVALSFDSTGPKQLRDYVSHRLRESAHVCRYARGTAKDQRYVHVADECSTTCKTIDVQNPGKLYEYELKGVHEIKPGQAAIATFLCPSCNLRLPSGSECGYCD